MSDTYYVVQRPAHVTFNNVLYLVPEGQTLEQVRETEDGEYLGYTDADWTDGPDDAIEGPFGDADAAITESSFYIEGS